MSWGIRITILYLAFMAMILFLVFRTMNEKVELVSSDYYQQELKFQDRINRQSESMGLAAAPQAQVLGKEVEIRFPQELLKEQVSGSLKFYRPSDSSKDFSTNIQLNSSGTQVVSTEKFETGIYHVQITWSAGGKNYYNEIPLYIP